MKKWLFTMGLAATTALSTCVTAPAIAADDSNITAYQSHDSAYLGVLVMPVHPGFASHLKGALSRGQGLMVAEVAPNSPAAKAEIKAHDILLTYDDQKLFSAEQMAKLIHSDDPGRQATIGLIRDGKSQKVQVTLAKLDHRAHNEWMQLMEEQAMHQAHPRRFERQAERQQASEPEWQSFDSLTVKKLGKDKFHVDVEYLGKDNQPQKHQFEGSRDDIRKLIRSEKDLKPAERAHLLRSLNMSTGDDDSAAADSPRANDQKEGT
ncbi:MAG TPA: PDZ domain-containing protein [Schlesneria sp.]|jgi:membrane-associated protease RseP (regulator of RpoE activity)